jgi:lipopolysaccharide export system protein LptA
MSAFIKFLLRLGVCLVCLHSLHAQMTPTAPVKDFSLPRFGENGYTEWVLQGGQGIYDSAEQIRIKEMALRVYSGDERMALELTLDSPEAKLLLKENRADSDSPIVIVGANFKISGVGWSWNGLTKEIEVKYDVLVEFTQALSDALAGGAPTAVAGEVQHTEIRSGHLVLQTTHEHYRFEFTEAVHAVSGDMNLTCNVLIALADTPEGKTTGAPDVGAGVGQLDAVRQIIARDQVVIEQAGRIVRAGEAEFLPREKAANLSGMPQIETSGAYLSGHTIRSREGELVITGGSDAGRAQMILSRTGGLGIQGESALSSETIVLADTITMQELEQENRFLFDGSVEVMSGAVQMSSKRMTILANKADGESVESADEDDAEVKLGEVRSVVAEGEVRIEQSGQIATSDMVTFYPADERAVLTGNPRVTNGEAIVIGEVMQLKPGLAIVEGSAEKPVVVTLPVMPDLGYEGFGASAPAAVEGEAAGITLIKSRMVRMIEEPTHTLFRFSEDVQISATNLEASCARLDVTAREKPALIASQTAPTERLAVERIEAFENVMIKQAGRVATADQAVILPDAGTVTLEGGAVVIDERGRVSGHRMTLLQGERRAIVEGGGPDGERARITLPDLPNSKF